MIGHDVGVGNYQYFTVISGYFPNERPFPVARYDAHIRVSYQLHSSISRRFEARFVDSPSVGPFRAVNFAASGGK
jgi:hypothetical protein